MEIFSVNIFELHFFLSILTAEAISIGLFKRGFRYCDLIKMSSPHIGNVLFLNDGHYATNTITSSASLIV